MTNDDIQELKNIRTILNNKSAQEKGDIDYCINSLNSIIHKEENKSKINHEYNFMKRLLDTKIERGSDVTLFEWNKLENRWSSDIIETGWCGYRMAVYDLTGENV